MKRVYILISGRVQGVFYRATAESVAKQLRLTGYVKNLPDGRVEIVAEGDKHSLEQLIDWAGKGSRLAKVENVNVEWEEATGEFKNFRVEY